MRILHVLAPAQAGGLERVVQALVIGQQRRSHTVTVVPVVESYSADHPLMIPLARANVDIRPVVVARRAYRRERLEFDLVLRDFEPDVVHSHGYRADVVDAPRARRIGAATVSTLHGFTRGPWRNRVYEYLNRLALRRFDAVVAVSQPLADELIQSGLSTDRVYFVPNAWSRISTPLERQAARRELGLDPREFVAGWVGRVSREKGPDVFLDAIAELPVPIRVCIIGDGPERAPLESRASAVGIADRIQWAGSLREAARYFAAFDVLVISSRTEGVPMVLLEAMADRVPVVSTAVGGIPGVVSSHEAVLVPSEAPRELASAIHSVFEDPVGAASRALAAQSRLEREFADDAWLRRYEAIYSDAQERGRRCG